MSDGCFGQLTCTPSWMWQRLPIVSSLFWTPPKVGTVMETTVCHASLRRVFLVMVGINHNSWSLLVRLIGGFWTPFSVFIYFLLCFALSLSLSLIVALVCQGVSDLPVKKRVDARRALSKITEVRFPDARLFPLDSEQDATLLLRHLGSQRQRKLGFRSRRSHLLAQQVTFTPNSAGEGTGGGRSGLGTLCVSGYVRGHPLQVDRLVHLSGHGDFQLSQIDAPSDPLPLNITTARQAKRGKGGDIDMMVSCLKVVDPISQN